MTPKEENDYAALAHLVQALVEGTREFPESDPTVRDALDLGVPPTVVAKAIALGVHTEEGFTALREGAPVEWAAAFEGGLRPFLSEAP